jgi:drug/metabolite transporter (DMT)-like permease
MQTPRPAALPAVLAAFAILYLVWGTTYLATREVVAVLPPLLSRAACCIVAGAILVLGGLALGAKSPTRAEWAAAAANGTLLFAGCHGLLSVAQQHVASGLAALMIATIPLWLPLLGWAAPGGTRPGWPTFAGALLGLAGIAVLTGGAGAAGGLSFAWAVVLLLSALCWAAGTVLGRHLPRPSSAALAAGMALLAGGTVLGLIGVAMGEASVDWPSRPGGRVWAALAYLMLGSYVVAFGCYLWLLDRQPVERVGTYAFVNPLVAVLAGWLLAGEELNIGVGVAAALIISAVVVTVSAGRS